MTNLNLASPNNAILSFPELPFGLDGDKQSFELNIFGNVIPRINFDTNEVSYQAFQTKRIDGPLQFDPLNTQFLVDEEFKNWKLVFEWMNRINNNQSVAGKDREQYTCDASLIIYNDFGQKILGISFVDLFPYDLSEVSFSYRDGEGYLESACVFGYDYYIIEK